MPPLSKESGIAIGPILFVIALLGVLAMAMSSGSGSMNIAATADRVTADIVSQSNLIRTKIFECNLRYGTDNNGDGFPASDTTNGTLVSALVCEGDTNAGLPDNLWTGARPLQLPRPTAGFPAWMYVNAGTSGGRCVWTQPTSSGTGISSGLANAARKFSSQEVLYSTTTQKFVVILTPATGTPNSNCLAP